MCKPDEFLGSRDNKWVEIERLVPRPWPHEWLALPTSRSEAQGSRVGTGTLTKAPQMAWAWAWAWALQSPWGCKRGYCARGRCHLGRRRGWVLYRATPPPPPPPPQAPSAASSPGCPPTRNQARPLRGIQRCSDFNVRAAQMRSQKNAGHGCAVGLALGTKNIVKFRHQVSNKKPFSYCVDCSDLVPSGAVSSHDSKQFARRSTAHFAQQDTGSDAAHACLGSNFLEKGAPQLHADSRFLCC